MSITIGIDAGGTQIRVAAVDANRRIIAQRRIRTASIDGYEAFLAATTRMVQEVAAECAPGGPAVEPTVGLAVPGPVDRQRGVLRRSVNVPFLANRPIAADLSRNLGTSIVLLTDAEAATWGEYTATTPPPSRLAHLRFGTGIALGLVIDGELHRFDDERTTHLPILVVEEGPNAFPCPCGLRGCLEAVASAKALGKFVDRGDANDPLQTLRALCDGGDSLIEARMRRVVKLIGVAIHRLHATLAIECVVLGGGVITALPRLVSEVASTVHETTAPAPSVEMARMGDDAGVVGASLLARQAVRSEPSAEGG